MKPEEMKELLKQGWLEVLQIEEVNDDTDFFEAGGNSIMAVQLPSWLVQKGIKLDIMDIFTAPTFGEMATKLKETDPMYMPEEMITKEVAARAMGFSSVEEGREAERSGKLKRNNVRTQAEQQKEDSQICTPEDEKSQQDDSQICTPEESKPQQDDSQICTPEQQNAPQFNTHPQFAAAPAALQGQVYYMPVTVYMPVMMPGTNFIPAAQSFQPKLSTQQDGQICTPEENKGYSSANAKDIPEQLKAYFPKAVDKPIEKPNVVKIQEAKIAEKTKSPEKALMDVMIGIKPSFNRDVDFFEQGISSLDTVKMVTRCGEAGYKLELKDIYMHSTFDELLNYLK